MTKGIAPVIGGRVQYVTALRIAIGGTVRDVKRALVACGGTAREVWPPDYLPPGDLPAPDPAPAAANVIDREQSPTDARAGYRFNNAGGFAEWDRFNNVVGIVFINPPAQAAGTYLIRMDVVSGVLLGDSTGVWLDPTIKNIHEWYVENTQDAPPETTVNAEGTFRIALDDGGGSPAAGTEVTQDVTFRAEVFDDGDGFLWDDSPWVLEDCTVGEAAQVRLQAIYLPYTTLGYGRGYEGTDNRLKFDELYSNQVSRAETVRVEPVSGDTGQITGAALSTDLPLDFVNAISHNWFLRAENDQESYEAVVDFIFTSGIAEVRSKRVTLKACRDDGTTSPTVFSDLVGVFAVISGNSLIQLTLEVKANGELNLRDQTGSFAPPGASTYPKYWGQGPGATPPPDPENFSVRLRQNSGNGAPPNWPVGGFPPLGAWTKVGPATTWTARLEISPIGPRSISVDWLVDIRNDLNGEIKTVEVNGTLTLTNPPTGGPGDPQPEFPPLGP